MGGLFIFWIIVIIIVLSSINAGKKKRDAYGGARSGSGPGMPGPGHAGKAGGAGQPPALPKRDGAKRSAQGSRPLRTVTSASAPVPSPGAPEEGSTLDYLADKAQEDQMNHAREEMEQRLKMEQEAARNGYTYAKRLPDSGVPGPNESVAVCRYCGAENVLPRNASGRYNCYFCREELGR